ncbi:MAG: RNA methyltransferase [Sphingomonas sp. 28-66-16]|nr:MAG: RNA methyltransferase [Sphingomonas sp. 28-66-16]
MSDADLIVRIAGRGEGVTSDGRYRALTAPGDQLCADGSIMRGPHHQSPPCRHFPRCGGCQLQHLDDASYAGFIVDRIAGALTAQGLATAIRPPLLSPAYSRRRATFHAERLGKQILLGFSEAGSHQLIDIAECVILDRALFATLRPLRRLLAGLITGKRRVEITLSLIDQGVDVLISGVDAAGLEAAEAISAFGAANGIARLSIDNGLGPETRWEPVGATIVLGEVPVGFPTAAFLQATADGEAALVASVKEAIGPSALVADLFAGLGTFALALAGPAKVYAAEAGRDAHFALKAAAGLAQRPVFAEHRDLYRRPLTVAELDRFDAIVLDPPRAGAREQAEALAGSKAPVIAYVSCNPGTFARDAKTICEGGYLLDWIQPVGQFRWSTHVELVARFSR